MAGAMSSLLNALVIKLYKIEVRTQLNPYFCYTDGPDLHSQHTELHMVLSAR